MKKVGFTLSELIVALSIIAVLAAVVVPVVGRFIPDTKKANVLKYYNLINTAIVDLYNDSSNFTRVDCTGIDCYEWNSATSLTGAESFTEYLSNSLDIEDGITPDGLGVNIIDNDGLTVVNIDTEPNRAGISFNADVADPSDLADVDTYIFFINNEGEVSYGDMLTGAYLRNPYKYNDKQTDFETAKELLQEEL